jgi:hypothetical protein
MLASPGAKVAAPRLVVADHVARVDATKMITDALATPVADADVVQLGPDVQELVADLAIQGALDDDELDPREVALALGVLAPAIGDGEPHGAAGLMLDPAQGDSQSDAGGELMLASFHDLFDRLSLPLLPHPALPTGPAHRVSRVPAPEARRSLRLRAKPQMPAVDKVVHVLLSKMGIDTKGIP